MPLPTYDELVANLVASSKEDVGRTVADLLPADFRDLLLDKCVRDAERSLAVAHSLHGSKLYDAAAYLMTTLLSVAAKQSSDQHRAVVTALVCKLAEALQLDDQGAETTAVESPRPHGPATVKTGQEAAEALALVMEQNAARVLSDASRANAGTPFIVGILVGTTEGSGFNVFTHPHMKDFLPPVEKLTEGVKELYLEYLSGVPASPKKPSEGAPSS